MDIGRHPLVFPPLEGLGPEPLIQVGWRSVMTVIGSLQPAPAGFGAPIHRTMKDSSASA